MVVQKAEQSVKCSTTITIFVLITVVPLTIATPVNSTVVNGNSKKIGEVANNDSVRNQTLEKEASEPALDWQDKYPEDDHFDDAYNTITVPQQDSYLPPAENYSTVYQATGDFGSACSTIHGQYCNKDKFLECVDDRCYCEMLMHRIYDNEKSECVNLVGSWCQAQSGPKCIENAVCNFGRCACRQGYSATGKRMCRLEYGEPCQAMECNGEKGFGCKDGFCKCLDSLFLYDPFKKVCFNPEGVFPSVLNMFGRHVVTTGLGVAKGVAGAALRVATGGLLGR